MMVRGIEHEGHSAAPRDSVWAVKMCVLCGAWYTFVARGCAVPVRVCVLRLVWQL